MAAKPKAQQTTPANSSEGTAGVDPESQSTSAATADTATETPAEKGPTEKGPTEKGPGAKTREAALTVIGKVLRGRVPLDTAFDAALPRGPNQRRNRAFVRQLVLTTLRRLGQIDALIDHCLDRPLPNGAAGVRDALRLGVCQLVFLRVADHAAVSETVELATAAGHPRLKGLVNAVLRRLSREGAGLAKGQDADRFNTPDWLWANWSAAYGEDAARAIAHAHAQEPPLDLTPRAEPAIWAVELDGRLLPTGTIRRETGQVDELPGYAEGAWWVQDAAAALPARLFGDLDGQGLRGRTVIDLCAAPGGKTAQLAAAGARVIAVDRSAPRMATLAANLDRLGLDAQTVVADAAIWRPEAPADALLLDAPCTATGTIRRNPDVPWSKTPADMAKLTRTQDRLLAAALEMVRPGGTIVYCTCSLQPEEGPERIEALIAAGAPVDRAPIDPAELGGQADFVTAQGDLRTLPSLWEDWGGLDGFYAARLRKR